MPKNNKNQRSLTRPPVVVILGHVDHGKTTILDFIRKTKVAEKESGGITQHIGAYQIEHQGKKITFIDTPGHEMFSAMRSRGAEIADIAVLVVAAEEGIKPQTKEAIEHTRKAKLPLIVAINKIDKKEAQPEKIKNELSVNKVLVESLGGDIPQVNTSAKTGQGIDELLEIINLVAEMEELKSNEKQSAEGVVIEAHRDDKRGITATLLVKQGTLTNKDVLATSSAWGKIKTMEDFRFKPIQLALPSMPVIVTGFNQAPQMGESFSVFESIEKAQSQVKKKEPIEGKRTVSPDESDKKTLNIILKADVCGCLEALEESLKNIQSDEVALNIIKANIGQVTDSDVKLAETTNSKIIGFRVKIGSSIRRLAQQKKIRIITFDVVYELIQEVRQLLANLLEPEIIINSIGQLKVLALFRTEKDRQIIGGKVIRGKAKQGALIKVIREGKELGQGKVVRLQRDKKETDEVSKDQECGILFKGSTRIEEKDILEFFEEEKRKKEL